MKSLKHLAKRLINVAGFELRRIKPKTNPAYQLLIGLKRFDIDLVFDVGANAGQFASELRDIGYAGEIVSFEPLSAASLSLSARAADDSKWHVHQRGAIGDFDGEIEINISGNSVSSSVLPMTEAHSSASIKSAYVGSEKYRYSSSIRLPRSIGLRRIEAFSRSIHRVLNGRFWTVQVKPSLLRRAYCVSCLSCNYTRVSDCGWI